MSKLDQQIGDKLNSIQPTIPDGAWKLFEQHKTDRAAQEFDQAVKTKIAQSTSGQTHKYSLWDGIIGALQQHSKRTTSINLIKSMETMVIILCLMWFNESISPSLQIPIHPLAPDFPEQPDPSSVWMRDAVKDIEAVNGISKQDESTISVTSIHSAARASDIINQPISLKAQDQHALLNMDYIPTVDAYAPDADITEFVKRIEPSNLVHSIEKFTLAGSGSPIQEIALSEVNLPVGNYPNIPPKRPIHRLHLGFTGDLHLVMTPYDKLLTTIGYEQYAGGYGIQIGYSREFKQWGVRALWSYKKINYQPKPYTEVFDGDVQRGYFTDQIAEVEMNNMVVSGHVTYRLGRNKQWYFYALAGGSGHLAFQANYDRRQRYLPGNDPLAPGEIPTPSQPSKTGQKKFADGFFEGGGLNENLYFTVDIGAGVERRFQGRLSIFLEEVYHHNAFKRSLGPNNDRINTFGTSLGIRMLL